MPRLGIWTVRVALVLFVGAAAVPLCRAGDKVAVGRTWPADQQISVDQIDHRAWNTLLAKYVDDQGLVNYEAWKASQTDVTALDSYLQSLSRADPQRQAAREAKLAFWINAYNAVTVRGILREYPTTSIRNHTAKVIGYNIWDDLLLHVGARQYSLNQMEHDVLRKMGEPRIHFAIVCASIGCPPLRNEAYEPARLDTQLSGNARRFFAQRRNFAYDAAHNTIWVSSIMKWFANDFGADSAAQMARIAPYLPDEHARRLATSGAASVTYLEYNWKLNDQKTAAAATR